MTDLLGEGQETMAPGAPRAVLEPGGEIDQYTVVRMLGRGGMGEVYLARDRVLGRRAALKVIRPGVLGDCLDRRPSPARGSARRCPGSA